MRGPRYLRWRAATFDRAVAALGLAVLALPMAAIAVAVLVCDGRPVLVRLPRAGKGGSSFQQLKFRTMRPAPDGAAITASADDRVTRLGAVLRRRRLDELPQLLNIVRGDMALVGPRPETLTMVDGSEAWRRVLRVKPGFGGVTQAVFSRVEAVRLVGPDPQAVYRHEILPAKLELDGWYCERANPKLDVLAFWAAFGSVLGASGLPEGLHRRIPARAAALARAS